MQRDKKQAIDLLIKDETDEPFATLGVGCVLYRQTIYFLICLFAVFSVITAPLYATYTKVEPAGIPKIVSTKFARSSLANLGYTSVQCALSPLSFEQMSLSCPYGEISSIVDNGLGVNLALSGTTDACLVEPQFGEDRVDTSNYGCSN
jgi:hypothetical protein